ncbi:hypothetical protein [Nocardioides korecus]
MLTAGLTESPGVVVGAGATDVLGQVQQLLASHRVWERFTPGAQVTA